MATEKDTTRVEKVAHTMGPWKLERTGRMREPFLIRADGFTIAVTVWNEHLDGDEEATARVIAAAPELLEAAESALRVLSEYGNGTAEISATQQLRAAIAKAEGRS